MKKQFFLSAAVLASSIGLTIHSQTIYASENYQGNRVITEGNQLYMIDEPGIIGCPDLACHIPIYLLVKEKQGNQYQTLSKTEISDLASSDRSIIKSENQLTAFYTNRLDKSNFITHIKQFDVTNPTNPSTINDFSFPGEMIAHWQKDDQLLTLTQRLAIWDNSHSNLTPPDQCIDLTSEALFSDNDEQDNSITLTLTRKHLDLPNQSPEQVCIDINMPFINEIDLTVSGQGAYILVNSGNDTQILRFHNKSNQALEYDQRILLETELVFDQGKFHLWEQGSQLLMASNHQDYDRYMRQAQIEQYDLHRQTWHSPLLLGNTENSSDITALTKPAEGSWFIAIQNENSNSEIIRVSTRLTPFSKRPYITARYTVEGIIQALIREEQDLLSAYLFAPDFTATTTYELLDIENPKQIFRIVELPLTEGFSQMPLVFSDRQTHYFGSMSPGQANIVIPTQNVITPSPFPLGLPLSGADNANRDVPTSQIVEIRPVKLQRDLFCYSWFDTCWHSTVIDNYWLELPYEGDDPSRARVIGSENHFYYVLGNQELYYNW